MIYGLLILLLRVIYTQVYDAARRAAIHHTILNFPEKYSTVVGERGLKVRLRFITCLICLYDINVQALGQVLVMFQKLLCPLLGNCYMGLPYAGKGQSPVGANSMLFIHSISQLSLSLACLINSKTLKLCKFCFCIGNKELISSNECPISRGRLHMHNFRVVGSCIAINQQLFSS